MPSPDPDPAPPQSEPAPPAGKYPRILQRILTGALIGALGGLWLVYRFVGDRTAWGEWCCLWPSFFWLVPLMPLWLLTWNRRARLRFFGVGLLFLLFLTTTMEWSCLLRMRTNPAAGGGLTLRVASWNVNSLSSQQILDRLAPLQPDLCFLQETPDGRQSIQPGDLAERWAGWHWLDDGDCGLLSRYPLTPLDTRRIGPWEAPQTVRVDLPGTGSLLAINVRLMLPSLVLNPLPAANRQRLIADHRVRLDQFINLAGLIGERQKQELPRAVLLAGDFNTPGRMRSLDPVRAILQDCWLAGGRGWGATMTELFPVSRIDQCWASSPVQVTGGQVLSGAPSDHRLLLLDLRIP